MQLSEPVSVTLINAIPNKLVWKQRDYPITSIGLHHTHYEGKKLLHTFSVVSRDIFFRLTFDTTSLTWRLDEMETD